MHQIVYSEVASKNPREATASRYTISYQKKDFKKSNVYRDSIKELLLQRLDLDTSASVAILTNIIIE